ncbi:TPA: PAAR domain-containing protein [Photobacterium damselae]
MVKIVTKGTKTSTGGEVLEGHNEILINGQPATSIHQLASCKSGRKSCKGMGEIVPIGQHKTFLSNGLQAVLPQYKVMCNCPDNVILEPSHHVFLGSNENGEVNLGQHSGGISIGNGVNINTGSGASVSFSTPLQEAPSTASQPIIDPKNAYWPPYDFTAPKEEKRIEVIYRSKVAKIAIFTQEEWTALFKAWDLKGDIITVKDTVTGLYDVRKTAQALGGIGVTAVVKEIDGVEYLYLSNYDKFEQTLLHGGIFRADNAQVVKMGLGALDSVKGMTRYVKVNAYTDFLIGSGINGLKYLLTDTYTLEQLGVDEAKIIVNTIAVAGVSLFLGSIAAASAPITVPISLGILVVSNFLVWIADKGTNFEKILIEAVVSEFDK